MKQLFLCLALALAIFTSCTSGQEKQSKRLAAKIQEQVMQRDTFQMVALTDFGWDFMLVVSPHASGAKVAEEYGFKLGEISPQSIDLSMRDNAAILLFISGGNAIAYCEYPIKCGDFSDLSKGANLFIAQHSCFAIDTASNQMRLVPCR